MEWYATARVDDVGRQGFVLRGAMTIARLASDLYNQSSKQQWPLSHTAVVAASEAYTECLVGGGQPGAVSQATDSKRLPTPWLFWTLVSIPTLSNCQSVASLGLVSPGAATDGVASIFFFKKLTTFFAHHCHFFDFTLVSPPGGCHPGRSAP